MRQRVLLAFVYALTVLDMIPQALQAARLVIDTEYRVRRLRVLRPIPPTPEEV